MPPLNRLNSALLAISACPLIATPISHAALITVNTEEDSTVSVDGCSLREAIALLGEPTLDNGCFNTGEAFGVNDRIVIDPLGNDTPIIDLDNSEISIENLNVSIEGNGTYISSSLRSRAFNISNSTVSIDSMTLQGNSSSNDGGAVALNSSTLILSNSKLYGNYSSRGAALNAVESRVEAYNVEVYGNEADRGGAGFRGVNSNFIINSSSFTDNRAQYSTGIQVLFGGGAVIENTTVSGNRSDGSAAGITSGLDTSLILLNSTVSSNTSTNNVGGIGIYGSTTNIRNSTVYANRSNNFNQPSNINIQREASVTYTNSAVNFSNSIMGGEFGVGPDCSIDGYSTFRIDQASIIENGGCSNNARAIDPMLGNLTDNGGNTQTHLPDADSPALDTGNIDICTNRDQRDQPRDGGSLSLPIVAQNDAIAVITLAGECDVGAVEVN